MNLSQIINDVLLLKQKKKDEKEKKFALWASDMGGCLRKIKLRQLGYPKRPYAIDSLNSFERGNTIHLWVADLLKSDEAKEITNPSFTVLTEEWLNTDEIVGRIDILLSFDGETHLIEVKTMDKGGIKYLQTQNIYETKPKDVLQLVCYYYEFKTKTIDTCRLIYISEDLSWKLEYLINPERHREDYGKEKEKLISTVASPHIPQAEFCFGCYSKKYGKIYCQYIEHCTEDLGIEITDNKAREKTKEKYHV